MIIFRLFFFFVFFLFVCFFQGDTTIERMPTHINFWYYLISSQSLNLGGRRGTTDDVATIPFHPSLSSAALRESPNPFPSIPWCYIPTSSSVFFSFLFLSLSLAELYSPCQRILRCGHTIWGSVLYHRSSLFICYVYGTFNNKIIHTSETLMTSEVFNVMLWR